jgi:glycosyltransferase involved in cell wall biosynthesis
MKKLTIAIPTFNGGKNLERAIRSCKNIQLSLKDYEILVIDNCSTDDSISNLNKQKDQFENLVLIENEENVGRIQNWNVCIDNATGKFLIFLFSNDTINEENNIHECIEHLDSNESISIGFSSLLKKEIESSYLKKSFSLDIIQCESECFTKECLKRGLLPFGPIQSILYRIEDIKKDQNQFLENLPINADEIFTYKEAVKRKKILFTPKPQITWDLTQGRFHGQMKIEDEFKEHSETIEIISKLTGIDVDQGLISTYRAINLLKFSSGNFSKNGKTEAAKHLLSKMKESKSFFNTDKILYKTFFNKLKNSKRDADDILYSAIIEKCNKNSN